LGKRKIAAGLIDALPLSLSAAPRDFWKNNDTKSISIVLLTSVAEGDFR
jgi:hypothetical protein